MPRRYASYEGNDDFKVSGELVEQFTRLHRVSTSGAFILATGLVIAAIVLLGALVWGRRASRNPWGGATLEWTCTSPPIPQNFVDTPTVGDPYIYDNLRWESKEQGYVAVAPSPPKEA